MKKVILGAILLVCTLYMMSPSKAEAASSSVKRLDEGKNYYYDLNRDGKKEKIRYTTSAKNDKVTVKIYVNKKKVYQGTQEALWADLYYTDFNSKDRYKDLYLQYENDSGSFEFSKILHYKGGKLKTICSRHVDRADFDPRRELAPKQKGNGTVTFTVDTPFYSETLGCYYIDMNYKIKKGTFQKCSESYYNASSNFKNKPYTLTKKIRFTKTRGGKSTAFTAKAGQKVYLNQLYCKKRGSAIYVQMRTKSGKKGWMKVPRSKFYREEYGWG